MQDRGMFQEQECRSCGCTDDDCTGCYLRTGIPCHWVEQDLCSACAQAGATSQDGQITVTHKL